jgi:undecaprenyl-diphosphatase
MWFVAAGTLPAVIVGLLFEQEIEETLRSPLVTVVTLTVFGMFLYLCERRSRLARSLDQFSWGDALWIGLSQALALIPGVSRSGITMSTALLRNADRASAARFSFLLATPVIVGAGVLETWRLLEIVRTPAALSAGIPAQDNISWAVLAIGILFAAVTGFFCIRFFLRYLQTRTFVPFVVYRFVLAAVVLAFYLRDH